jgi:histidinol-phosphatase (PHP family)
MRTDELFEYAESVRELAKEYEADIRVLLGFELEYYPDYHEEEMAFLRQVNPDYLLLGQHYIGNEKDLPHVNAKLDEKDLPHVNAKLSDDYILTTYATQVISALATGDFLYLAHPDMPGFNYSEQAKDREYRRICEFAKKKNIPLEINLWGLNGNRCYPSREFFKIASEVGNDVVIGMDAHKPEILFDKDILQKALGMVEELKLHLIEKPII